MIAAIGAVTRIDTPKGFPMQNAPVSSLAWLFAGLRKSLEPDGQSSVYLDQSWISTHIFMYYSVEERIQEKNTNISATKVISLLITQSF